MGDVTYLPHCTQQEHVATNTAMELTADASGSPRAGELFIAGIGAGAGGVEALTAFFGQVKPGSGFAYVVMMQDPGRSPAGMLAGISPLPVSEVVEFTDIRPDHIYIVSPIHALHMQDGRIVVTGHPLPDEQRDPIDALFCLLAESYGERAASVVLSGTGLTTTTGLKRTNERGGTVFVQDPREALHPNMPRRAVASGFSNGAFPAADIPAQLIAHARQAAATSESPSRKPRLNMAALHHQLLEYYAPPSVVIDAADNVLHLSPQAGRYLRIAGEPSRNLLALVHPELRRDLQKACNQARQDGMNVEIRNLQVRIEDRHESLTIHVRPVREEGEAASLTQRFMLVLFERTDEPVRNPVTVLAAEAPGVQQLEAELLSVKTQLSTYTEQHEAQAEQQLASNEELQAMNEQLRASAEELELRKEELQSTNEELTTVTRELQAKVDEIAHSSSNFQNLINSTDLAALFLDRRLRVKLFTPAAATIFNLIESDLGRPLSDITNILLYDQLHEDAGRVLDTLVPVEQEVHTRDDRAWLMRVSPYRSADDRINGVVLTFTDITRLKKPGDAFRIMDERDQARRLAADLQALLDASPAFIGLFKVVHTDNAPNRIDDFVLAVGNRRLSEYVGVPLDRLTGRHAAEFGELLWGADTMHILREVYAGAQTRYDEKAVMREGEEHWTGVSVSKRDDGLVLTGLDITALKQAQHQQQFWLRELEKSSESAQALAKLRIALQERSELLRSASHDLRGQVGVIASATHLLGMAGTEGNSGILIQMIRRNIQQMTHLMTSLLDYSRLEAGQETIQVSRFNVGEVLQELIDSLEPHAGERGLWLRSSGPDSLEVETDPVQIRRIVQNLLLNALKYTKTGGATVSWQLLGKVPGWQLDVSDTGPGLSPYQLGRLRDEPQAALEPGRARRVGSEGIGLSIVKQLCKMLGGRLIVESELGKGTVFTIRFDGSSGPDMA